MAEERDVIDEWMASWTAELPLDREVEGIVDRWLRLLRQCGHHGQTKRGGKQAGPAQEAAAIEGRPVEFLEHEGCLLLQYKKIRVGT